MQLRKLGVSIGLVAISTFASVNISARASAPNVTLRVQGSQKPDNPNPKNPNNDPTKPDNPRTIPQPIPVRRGRRIKILIQVRVDPTFLPRTLERPTLPTLPLIQAATAVMATILGAATSHVLAVRQNND